MNTSQSEASYRDFLVEVANEVFDMFCGAVKDVDDVKIKVDGLCVEKRFEIHCNAITEKYNLYLDAKERAETNLPPDPTSPGKWRELEIALAGYYAVLAVIYNMMLAEVKLQGGNGWWKQRKLKDLLTKSGDSVYVFLAVMWGLIKGRSAGYNEGLIGRALKAVKKDLIDNCRIRQSQDAITPKAEKSTGAGEEKKPKESTIKSRFSFEPGRILFDDNDLELPTGEPVEIMQKLVKNFGHTVSFETFDKHYSSATPGTLHKNISIIRTALKRRGIPCKINTKTGYGYLFVEAPPSKKKVRI